MKLYGVTTHAIDQAVERLQKPREFAQQYINQLMQTAVHQGTTSTGRVFDHISSRTRLILDLKKDKIITVYSMDSEKPPKWYDGDISEVVANKPTLSNAIIEKARVVIQRELAKAKRQFTREYRLLTQQHAEINVEVAYLLLNHAKCKQPRTQALIQTRIDAMTADLQRTADALNNVKETYEHVRKDAESYIGGYAE